MRTLSLLFLTAAVCTAAVTPPEQIKVPAGFKVELLREAGPGEGSWICITQDEQGRLYLSSQSGSFAKDGEWGGIWRVTLATNAAGEAQNSKLKAQNPQPTSGVQPGEIRNPQSAIRNFEKVRVPISDAMGMLWAFDSLYVSGMGPQGRGIYRCKSSKGDGNLDTATLFKAIPGGAGEHGAHAIILGPDKKLYIVNGNSTGILDGLSPDSPYRHWGEDDLLPRLRDPVATFFDKIKAPYGCVYRTDADGTKWELFAGGFRNPYDIAFNPDGELFTYDSDMEWDRGLPWYRPTRILHVVPGGEYGFREGSAKWPAYFPDSLPAVADIGVGCPTGMKFGTDAKGWPEKYRRALFLHDWTYGRILAVTLHEKGASYTARNDLASYTYPRDAEANGDVEVFLSGKGMPVTDLEFLRDGSMVFTVGGRGTAAALYRVTRMGLAERLKDLDVRLRKVTAEAEQAQRATIEKREAAPQNPLAERPRTAAEIDAEISRLTALVRETEKELECVRQPAGFNAPEAQRKLAGGAASEASATTGSPSAKASAPDGARETLATKAPSPTLSEIRVNDSALPTDAFGLGVGQIFKRLTRRLVFENAEPLQMNRQVVSELKRDLFHYSGAATNLERWALENRDRDLRIIEKRLRSDGTYTPELAQKEFAQSEDGTFRKVRDAAEQLADGISAADQNNFDALVQILTDGDFRIFSRGLLTAALSLARVGEPTHQETVLNVSKKLTDLKTRPSTNQPIKLPDDLKLLQLRVLELSFARQGRPSEERVKAVMEELLAHYPVPPGGTRSVVSPINQGADGAAPSKPSPGAPVDDPAWRLNRELCALLIWLSNPELGALNADLAKAEGAGKPAEPAKAPAPTPAKGKTGRFQPGNMDENSPALQRWVDGHEAGKVPAGTAEPLLSSLRDFVPAGSGVPSAEALGYSQRAFFQPENPISPTGESVTPTGESVTPTGESVTPTGESVTPTGESVTPTGESVTPTGESVAPTGESVAPTGESVAPTGESVAPTGESVAPTGESVAPTGESVAPTGASAGPTFPSNALLAQAAPAAAKADTLPTEAPPAVAKPLNPQPSTLNSGLGPVPNPGADIVPGRKGAAFHAELGRQVIEKTLALMDAAPSQEEQIHYALCLRWAHGWTPEQRMRYFRWFHEKASRFTGGNSFAKFVEAIRADAASRVSLPEVATLTPWMRAVAAPAPAALKPRAFVKAWTLPELEAALDKLKDRQPDLARGKELYTQAQCAQCHLFRDAGGNVGPDLTAVAQRFGRHDILESITDPSKVVSEQYAMITLTVLDGKGGTAEVSGLVKDESSATITLLTDPLAGKTANLYKNVVVKREKAAVSIMPPGLLYTLTAEEVADLMALVGVGVNAGATPK